MIIKLLPQVLQEKLGKEGAEAMVSLLNVQSKTVTETVLNTSENRFEKRLTEEASKINQRLTEEMAKLKTSLIMWMFVFWIGQAGVVIAIVKTLK
jgi:hypothetical protein